MGSIDEWLSHPAFHAGVAPLLVACVVAALLRRSRLLALVIGAAFLTSVALVMGWSFETLTSLRKMVLVGVAAVLLVLPLELRPGGPTRRVRAALACAAAGPPCG